MTANELELVLEQAEPPSTTPEIGLASFVVRCAGDASDVLGRARAAFVTVLRHLDHIADDISFWQSALPESFVRQFGPEISSTQAEALRLLPIEQRMQLPWTMSSWIYWFTPQERQWYWWAAWCSDDSTIVIEVQPVDWPFAHGALDWLFIASGAQGITEDDGEVYE